MLASLPNTEDQLRARWQDADLTWRRAVIDAVVESVVVAPKGHRGGKRFDPGRVESPGVSASFFQPLVTNPRYAGLHVHRGEVVW